MYSRQIEQLARQRTAELSAAHPAPKVASAPGRQLRSKTGWAIVAVGLRIAESGSHRAAIAAASPAR